MDDKKNVTASTGPLLETKITRIPKKKTTLSVQEINCVRVWKRMPEKDE
jgi:hypothetical protein